MSEDSVKIHGKNRGFYSPNLFYLSLCRDKIKILASEYAMYEPFGVDVFLSSKKISHIAKHVELPRCGKVENLPSILILNIQVSCLLHS
jgi:hypothetical protein